MHTEFISRKEVRRGAVAFTVVLVLLSLFLLAKTVNEIKAYGYIGAGTEANTVSVSGEGEVFAVPDIATFSFSVIVERESVEEAQTEATETINEAIAFLEGEGIEEKDIKTLSYNVYPQYDFTQQICREGFCPPGNRELRGFEVSQTVSVKVRETARAGELLAGLGAIGIEQVSGLQFTIDDESELLSQAREAAIADAQEKAEALAEDLGVRLVRVVSFSDSTSGHYPKFRVAVEDSAMGSAAPELPIGENRILSQVTVTYEIR